VKPGGFTHSALLPIFPLGVLYGLQLLVCRSSCSGLMWSNVNKRWPSVLAFRRGWGIAFARISLRCGGGMHWWVRKWQRAQGQVLW